MKREIARLLVFAVSLLLIESSTRAQDPKRLRAEVQESFKQFAEAVNEDNYQEAARWITPPADKVWTNFAAFLSAWMKYRQALEEKLGQGEEVPGLLPRFAKKGGLAEHLYETAGTIQDVKQSGKDRAIVRVWTRRPDWRKRSETALYERTFTAIKLGDRWKFQLHTFGGTPVIKKVKRKSSDGKEVEVYAEHYPKIVTKESTWVELEPISYEGGEKLLKLEAEMWAKSTRILQAQREQVQKNAYTTRDEAIEALNQEMQKVFEAMRKESRQR